MRTAPIVAVLALCAAAGGALDYTDGELKAIEAMYGADHIEGDMVPAPGSGRAHNTRVKLWPSGAVYYKMTNQFSSYQKGIIEGAMQHIQQHSCIRFYPRTNQKSFINIHKNKAGCFATIGMSSWPGGQTVNLADNCLNYNKIGTAVHEFMHTLGFMHEHKRPDRDEYVEVLWDNIKTDAARNFKKNFEKNSWTITDTSGTAYDTGSIMQYPSTTFSANGQPTVRSKTGAKLGQFDGLSATDVYELNKVYGCDMSRVPTAGVKLADGGSKATTSAYYRATTTKVYKATKGPTGTDKDCVDKALYCAKKKSSCARRSYIRMMCPKTCGTC